jgi:hypothetical protein
MRGLAIATIAAATIAGATAVEAVAGADSLPAPCKGRQLAVAFDHIAGSDGAGHTAYLLRLRNVSRTTCTLSGLPGRVQLLDRRRRALPTHVVAEFPGALTAVLVRVAPGGSAYARGRFSPDVPSRGDATRGQCQPTARFVRITPAGGGGSATGPVRPATPVCGRGTITMTAMSSHR